MSNLGMEDLRILFARNVLAIKKKKGLTEAQLVALGVPAGSAHRAIAKGGQNIRFETLEKWARALRTSAWELIHPNFNPEDQLLVSTESGIEAEIERRVNERIKAIADTLGGKNVHDFRKKNSK